MNPIAYTHPHPHLEEDQLHSGGVVQHSASQKHRETSLQHGTFLSHWRSRKQRQGSALFTEHARDLKPQSFVHALLFSSHSIVMSFFHNKQNCRPTVTRESNFKKSLHDLGEERCYEPPNDAERQSPGLEMRNGRWTLRQSSSGVPGPGPRLLGFRTWGVALNPTP